jgi:lipopolysaccharide export system permease protein
MLKILDLYIIKKYLSTFFFTMVLITMIAMAINYFEQVDKFVDSGLSAGQIFTQYYIHYIPWINGLMWPLFSLLAVIFFTSRMAKNSEIISILCAGVTYTRLLRPFLLAGGFLAIVLWIGINFVIPNSNKHKNDFEVAYIKSSLKSSLSYNIHFFTSPDEKIYIRNYSDRDSTGRTFRLDRFRNGELVYSLKANKITFKQAPNTWEIENYEIRTFDNLNETLEIASNAKLDTVFNFVPEDFTRYANQIEIMTTSALRKFLEYEQAKGLDSGKKYSVEINRRSADPFTIIILTIIGVAVASRKVRGGMGLHLAVGVILGAAFVILSRFSTTFSTNLSLSPGLGVWIPNIIFSLIAVYLVKTAQK